MPVRSTGQGRRASGIPPQLSAITALLGGAVVSQLLAPVVASTVAASTVTAAPAPATSPPLPASPGPPELRRVGSPAIPATLMATTGPRPPQPSAAAARGPRALRVTFLGDSITAAGDWQRRFPEAAITNAGQPGDTTLDLLARLGPVRDSRPQLVLLMVGINDLLRGAREEAVAERIALIRQLLTASGQVRLIQQSTLACEASRCGAAVVARVRRLNRLLRAGVAADDFLDVDAVLSDATGLRPTYSVDGLHLSPAGYNRWQDLLRRRLGRQLGRSAPGP